VDYVQSLAEVARQRGWVRPEVHEGFEIYIEEGRHPVIDAFTRSYVPNDTRMNEEEFILVITGPNMAGKSSYIRQVALLVLLSHMGSFVPAKRASIGNVDAIFTRIGSGDVLAMGVSTFMNEMLDVAGMLSNATNGSRTLLATHFLELTELEGKVKGVRNYHMAVSEEEDGVVFLYTLLRGKAEGSFGIEVAKMAGLPESLIERAREILLSLEDKTLPVLEETFIRSEKEMEEKEESSLMEEILSLDIANMTPLQALVKLSELRDRIARVRGSRADT